MKEARTIAVMLAVTFLVGGLIVLPFDTTASLVLMMFSSLTFAVEKVMSVKKRRKRVFHVFNLYDGSETRRNCR